MCPLHAKNLNLHDLAAGAPELFDISGRPTGVTLRAPLGAGGMSAVFLATLDPSRRSNDLSPHTPDKLVVKFMKPRAQHEAERMGMDSAAFYVREVVALGRMMERRPPTEFVVGFHGSGRAAVEIHGHVVELPWLAIELVDGGGDGVTLAERVERTQDGVDPVRALRLLQGIFEGAQALHGEGILHRDIKPENILIAGPIDDETPKLADCGIARVDGISGTVPGMTPMYGGPEQSLSMPWERNPLVGPWTDVHAIAAVAWYVLAGEHWYRGSSDGAFQLGIRRSLRTAMRVHPGLLGAPSILAQINAVLVRGAAPRIPAPALEGQDPYLVSGRAILPSMFTGQERYATVEELRAALFPLLEQSAAAWRRQSAITGLSSTVFRTVEDGARRPTYTVEERTWQDDANVELSVSRAGLEPALPGGVVFQPDNRVVVRFGGRLAYFVGDRPLKVAVPEAHRDTVAASRFILRGPAGGYALVGARHVLLIRGTRFIRMPRPERPGGGEVGEIQAAVGGAGVFAIVTAETDDANGGAELWTSSDGDAWTGPTVLPLGGDARAISHGPHGYVVVGARKGARGRALHLPFDDHAVVYAAGVNEGPPLGVVQCGAEREAWAAGRGFVITLGRGQVTRESVEADDDPVAMGLDLIGVPWLVTETTVLRRDVEDGMGVWRSHYRRARDRCPLIAIGFAKDEVRALDMLGNSVRLHRG